MRLGERKRQRREPTEKEGSMRRDGENKAKAGGRATRPSYRVSGDFFRFLIPPLSFARACVCMCIPVSFLSPPSSGQKVDLSILIYLFIII